MPLNYSAIDANAFTGKTYYFLKQQDLDGKYSYSVVRVVGGSEATASLKIWPVPSAGDVNVLLFGIDKDLLQVFDVSGRLVKQVLVTTNASIKINGLKAGYFIIRLEG